MTFTKEKKRKKGKRKSFLNGNAFLYFPVQASFNLCTSLVGGCVGCGIASSLALDVSECNKELQAEVSRLGDNGAMR